MTEEDAQDWIIRHYGLGAHQRLTEFAAMVVAENSAQNLISPATVDHIWVRHLLDSAQLMKLAKDDVASWIDIGTGAGFPGLVIAALGSAVAVTLVEPRGRRAEFLETAASALGLANVQVFRSKAEAIPQASFDVVSARAVASLESLFAITAHLRTPSTRMILPRGRNGANEVAGLSRQWHGMFHVEQSLTDAESVIVVAEGVAR